MKYKTGDKPGAGRYRCDNCGYVVRITSDAEALPACPNCGHHEFTKLEDCPNARAGSKSGALPAPQGPR